MLFSVPSKFIWLFSPKISKFDGSFSPKFSKFRLFQEQSRINSSSTERERTRREARMCIFGTPSFHLNAPKSELISVWYNISKCTEFGTIKIWIVYHLPFTKVLNRAFSTILIIQPHARTQLPNLEKLDYPLLPVLQEYDE